MSDKEQHCPEPWGHWCLEFLAVSGVAWEGRDGAGCCAGHQPSEQLHPHCEGDRILIELHPATAVLQLGCRSRVNMINFIL